MIQRFARVSLNNSRKLSSDDKPGDKRAGPREPKGFLGPDPEQGMSRK